jgi:[ribosomal protein S5]-alanine N-acetyltransferase
LTTNDAGGLLPPMKLTKPAPILKGSRVFLTHMPESDVTADYLRWVTDPEINQYLEVRFQDHSIESLREFVRGVEHDRSTVMFKIELPETGAHIGNIKLGPVDWNHRSADIDILIGEHAHHGKGYGTESVVLLRDYAFDVLKLNKLTAGAYENNVGSTKIFERAGFEVEGIRKNQYMFEGEYVGLVMMGCYKELLND